MQGNIKKKFVEKVILQLNYQEFEKIKISYEKYASLFEQILRYMDDKFPEINHLLKLIDTGYVGNEFSFI